MVQKGGVVESREHQPIPDAILVGSIDCLVEEIDWRDWAVALTRFGCKTLSACSSSQ